MLIPPDAMPPATLVALVNGWGAAPRREAEEMDLPYPEAAPIAEALAVRLPDGALSERKLRRLADALYPVFATDDTALRASQVTSLLARFHVRPGVTAVAGGIEEVWIAPGGDALAAAALVTLRRQLLRAGPDRLGTCAGARCGDVYVDASPAGHRRYCSLTCQNRARVAAFRRRGKSKSIASEPGEA